MGKVLKVLELNKQIETKEHLLEVYAVFKDLKYGNTYAIYKDNNDITNDTLHYASSHFKENILVLLDIKDKERVENLVKEFTWNLVNNKENNNFSVFDISKLEKAEIISSNNIKVRDEVLKILNEKTIPKKVDKKVLQNTTSKKISSSSKILLSGFSLAFLIIIVFFVLNGKEIFTPVTIDVLCVKTEYNNVLYANVSIKDKFVFNTNNDLIERYITNTYNFDNTESYNEYKRLGLYYKYEPVVKSSTLTYTNDDVNNIFVINDNMTTEKEYFEPTNYDEVLSFMKAKNYECNQVVSEQ